MKKLILLLIAVSIIGCKGTEIVTVPITDSTTIETSETITDEPTWTDPQELLMWFAIECDSNYQALLKDFNSINSGLESNIEIKEVIRWKEDGTKVKQLQINIAALVDSLEVQNRTIKQLRNEKHFQEVPYPVETEVEVIPGRFKWYRNILLMLVLISASWVFLRLKFGMFK